MGWTRGVGFCYGALMDITNGSIHFANAHSITDAVEI